MSERVYVDRIDPVCVAISEYQDSMIYRYEMVATLAVCFWICSGLTQSMRSRLEYCEKRLAAYRANKKEHLQLDYDVSKCSKCARFLSGDCENYYVDEDTGEHFCTSCHLDSGGVAATPAVPSRI